MPTDPNRPSHDNRISGPVQGTAIQAQVIEHLTVTTPRHELPVPAQLPGTPRGFVNRSAELARLDDLSKPRDAAVPVVVVTGLRGVGKSATATTWAQSARSRFRDGQLYVSLSDMRRTGVVPTEEVVAGFLRALGVAPAAVPRQLSERVQLYRTLTTDKQILVVVDDLEHAAELLPLVPAGQHGCVVATASRPIDELLREGADVVRLNPLSAEEARMLILEMDPGTDDQDALTRILNFCDGLPLALRVCGAWLKAPNRDARDLASQLESAGHLHQRWNAVFDAAVELLSPDASVIYQAFGTHPTSSADRRVLAAAAQLGSAATGRALDELVDCGLADRSRPDRYDLHQLVHRHATAQAGDNEGVRERMVSWYVRAAQGADRATIPDRLRLSPPPLDPPIDFPSAAAALDWSATERANLVAAVTTGAQLGMAREVCELCEAMWLFLFNSKSYADWILVHRVALGAAKELDDPAIESRIRAQLARAQTETGDHDEAHRQLTEARALAQESNNPAVIAMTEEFSGILELERENFESAVAWLESALQRFSDLGWERAINIQRHHLGRAHRVAGHSGLAIELLSAAAHGLDRDHDAITLSQVTIELGLAHETLAPEQATDLLWQALELLDDLGLPYDRGRAELALGDINATQGDLLSARRHWAKAHALFRAIESPRLEDARSRLEG